MPRVGQRGALFVRPPGSAKTKKVAPSQICVGRSGEFEGEGAVPGSVLFRAGAARGPCGLRAFAGLAKQIGSTPRGRTQNSHELRRARLGRRGLAGDAWERAGASPGAAAAPTHQASKKRGVVTCRERGPSDSYLPTPTLPTPTLPTEVRLAEAGRFSLRLRARAEAT